MRCVLLLTLVLAFVPARADAAPSNVIHASDYASLPDAVNAWLAAEKAGTGGTLDLGTSDYDLTSTLAIAQPDGSPVFGTIRGDGPNLATIHCANGIARCIEFDDFWQGSLSGFGVVGAGYGTHAAGDNTDAGLVFAARHQDLGACCGSIDNVTSSGFGRCWMLGDDQAPLGAAAEFSLTNVQANWCGIGWAVAGNNSLDFVFNKPNSTQNGVTFQTIYGAPTQILVYGGGATNNDQEFVYRGDCGTFSIAGYRAEGRTRPDLPQVELGGCTGQQASIRDSMFGAQTEYSPVSILVHGSEAFLSLTNNDLIGTVQHIEGVTVIDSSGNTIYTEGGTPAFSFSDPNCCGAIHITSRGDHTASQVNGFWFGGWWPEYAGAWLFPPNQQAATSTPVPPTPTTTPMPTSTPTMIPPTVTPTAQPTSTPTVVCRVSVELNGVDLGRKPC